VPEGLERLADPAFAMAALQAAVPLYLAVLAALLCEQAGLVNLGLEGTMLAGAWVGAAWAHSLGPATGLDLGALAGVGLALLYALATIYFRVDQLVAGLAVNVLAFGSTRFLQSATFGPGGRSSALERLPAIAVPRLGQLSPLVPVALALGLAIWLCLRFGLLGLRLRAAGEAPQAAERAGLALARLHFAVLLAAGALAGLAGAGLTIEFAGRYQQGITQGRGFLALALCPLVGRSVLGGGLAALLLGALQALPRFLPAGTLTSLLAAAPWLVVLLALALLARRLRSPRAAAETWRAGASL
jgi:general nucleoside transport system permease protein